MFLIRTFSSSLASSNLSRVRRKAYICTKAALLLPSGLTILNLINSFNHLKTLSNLHENSHEQTNLNLVLKSLELSVLVRDFLWNLSNSYFRLSIKILSCIVQLLARSFVSSACCCHRPSKTLLSKSYTYNYIHRVFEKME